jgi:hypothetical protein
MAEGKWRTWATQLTYQRPYEDAWGALHDPTTEWDELLKYYDKTQMLLLVGDGTRHMARSAYVGARILIHNERQERCASLARASALEAEYLEGINSRKHWRRRQRKRLEARAAVGS